MEILYIIGGAVLFAFIFVLITAFVCFRMVFYNKRKPEGEFPIPEGKEYEPYADKMKDGIMRAAKLPFEEFTLTSSDGLKLFGRYYENKKGAPIELMLHGYRGSAKRDMSEGIFRAFAVGHNAFVVDHRASGQSEGNIITFGINEKRDSLDWLSFIISHFGSDVKVIITGISMGASTALMCSGEQLPENVVGILADCGYTSAPEIIKKVIRDMKLPPKIFYPFVRLGGKLFGGFDIEDANATAATAKTKIPTIFYHGDVDGFVPAYMSEKNYDACAARKKLVIIEGAEHGLCYLQDPKKYITTLAEFFPECSEIN